MDAISAAADSLVDGRIWWNRGELLGGNSNRANGAYEMNPAEERARYEHNVDKDMTLLKMVAVEGDKPIGAFTWWPVHPISFNGGINPLGKIRYLSLIGYLINDLSPFQYHPITKVTLQFCSTTRWSQMRGPGKENLSRALVLVI